MKHFVIIVNGFQPLTIITKCSILDVAAVLDLPLDPKPWDKVIKFSKNEQRQRWQNDLGQGIQEWTK